MKRLQNGNLVLRGFHRSDKIPVARYCNNKKIWDHVRDALPYPYTHKDASYFINLCRNEDPQITFAIDFEENFVGVIGLVPQTDIYKLSAEIGYWIGEPYWGKGFATEAVKLITRYGFENLGLIRIFTGVFDFNKPSQRVLEKAGYQLECIFKKAVIKNGMICDEYRYSILKNEN